MVAPTGGCYVVPFIPRVGKSHISPGDSHVASLLGIHYEERLSKLMETSGELLDESLENTATLMGNVIRVMKADVDAMKSIEEEDIIRYYPFYCMDKLQNSMDLCFSHDVSRVTEHKFYGGAMDSYTVKKLEA